MENTGASSGFQYKRRRILTQTQREEMENENQISAEVTPSVDGQSFLDAAEIESLKSILVPDKFEATAEWYLNFQPLETTKHPELDAFVDKLECRGEVHIPVERKRKARNVPSPTREDSEERNEHISSPQESQRSQSLRESPSRVSHSNIPNPSSPNPAKPSSNTFQELFDRMSKKIDNIAEEQRKRFEVLEKKVDALSTLINQKIVNKEPETTIMGDCEETEARNPSPDHKVSPNCPILDILQIVGEIEQEHENQPSTHSDSVLSLENRKAESTHETMGTEDATLMKPLHAMVEPSHEVMETHAAASMKTQQDKVVSPPKELGEEAEITDGIVYGKRVKKKSASLKSPYTADGRKKKKADELLSKPPTKSDLLEFKRFIVKAIKDDRPVQCYLDQHKEIQDFVKTFWTDLITPDFFVADTHLSEYLYVLRRRLCNDDGDSCIAPLEFNHYVNSYATDPEWPVLSGPLEKIVDGTYSEGPEAFKTKAWNKNTKYVYYLKGTESHWFCIKADFERCRLVVLDSLRRIISIEMMAGLLKDDLMGFKGIAGVREIGKHGFADWKFEYCTVPQQIDCDCGIFATAYQAIVISTLGSEIDYPIRIPDYDSDADDVTDDDDDVFVCKLEESHFRESSENLPLSDEFCEANGFVEGKTDVTLIGPNMQPVVCTLKIDCIGDGFLKRMWRYFVESNGLRIGDKLVMRPVGNNTFMVGVYRHHRR
ncbi:unnamed protein product [Cuscuta campestris]|uniref:TF-B3 domain-containing protein n=1 Tax=Cuscuta campestris TaxID=132261 RepID=A0A484N8C0_9ASTE|nr:unnamed protein product [Cuscuta campestris]